MRNLPAILLLGSALLLAGCGYRPLYGTTEESAGVSAALATVTVAPPKDRVEQLIRNDLISTMGAGSAGDRYTLTVTTEVKTPDIIDHPQPAVTREAVNIKASFDLVEHATGKSVFTGKTFSQASFDLIRQPFADMQAQTNATERAAHEVSADIRTRLAAYFSSHPPSP